MPDRAGNRGEPWGINGLTHQASKALQCRSDARGPQITSASQAQSASRSHIPFLAESAVLREALGPELYEAVLAVRRAEAELFAMFTDADVIEAVRWRC